MFGVCANADRNTAKAFNCFKVQSSVEILCNFLFSFICHIKNARQVDKSIINIVLIATTPLVFAGIGELVTEKTGVLNLGVEGMMLVCAVTAFVTLVITGSYVLAFLISILSGLIMSGLFAYLVLILMKVKLRQFIV